MARLTVSECEDRLEEIRRKIREYEDAPASTSRDGLSVDNSNKLEHLRKQESKWAGRLKRARNRRRRGSSSQGPTKELT